MPKRSFTFLVVMGLFGSGFGFIIPILDPLIYVEKIHQIASPEFKNSALSVITIAALSVALITQPLVGRWSDQAHRQWGSRRPYLIGGVLGLSISLLLIISATSLWWLLLAAMLTAATSNTLQSAWQALIPDQVPLAQRGKGAAIKTILEALGAIAGLTVAGLTLVAGNLWRALAIAVILLIIILFITLYTLKQTQNRIVPRFEPQIPALPNRQAPSFSPRAQLKIVSQGFNRFKGFIHRTPAFFWWVVNRILFWGAGITLRTFILNYLEDGLSLPLSQLEAPSRWLLYSGGATVIVLILFSGAIADRVGRRPVLIVAGLLACSGTLMLMSVRDLELLLVTGALIVAGFAIFASASWALVTDLVPRTKSAFYLGLANGATVIGGISGRVGGPLIDGINRFVLDDRVGYMIIFGLAALSFGLSSVVVLKIPEPASSRE